MVRTGSTGDRMFEAVDWRDRPAKPQEPECRFDLADMPEPFDIDVDLYFGHGALRVDPAQVAEAQARMNEAGAEMARLDALYESGEISAEECAHQSQKPSEEYFAMKDAVEHGRLDWNPCRGLRDGFTRHEYAVFSDEDAAAIDRDARVCVRALAEYVWRKEGIALDPADWNVSDLYPIFRSLEDGSPVTTGLSRYGDEGYAYTGYFFAELEKRSDYATEYGYEGYYWWPAFSVVFSPIGSVEHFRYGGMDGSQASRFKELVLDEVGPLFPLYEESIPPEGEGTLMTGWGRVQAYVTIDAFPSLGERGMLSEHLDEDVGWRSALTSGSELTLHVLYVGDTGDSDIDYPAIEEALSGSVLDDVAVCVSARIGATPGSDWDLYEGGETEWRVNDAWMETRA